jgi:hypothetical protein
MDYLKLPIDQLRDDLDRLNRELMNIEGSNLSLVHCYHPGAKPPYFLFNTNCPATLRQKLEFILHKIFFRIFKLISARIMSNLFHNPH